VSAKLVVTLLTLHWQEIVASLGWDQFLELRARVFVMHSETGSIAPATVHEVRLLEVS